MKHDKIMRQVVIGYSNLLTCISNPKSLTNLHTRIIRLERFCLILNDEEGFESLVFSFSTTSGFCDETGIGAGPGLRLTCMMLTCGSVGFLAGSDTAVVFAGSCDDEVIFVASFRGQR
jgi:hypothetical protein